MATNVDDLGSVLHPDVLNDLDSGAGVDTGSPPDVIANPDSGDAGGSVDVEEPEDVAPVPTCDDGLHNGDETDVDCGGPDCGPCGLSKMCAGAEDCQSGICQEGQCVDASCAGVECGSNQRCYQSQCYDGCNSPEGCGDDERCFLSACLPLDCQSTICGAGQSCHLGICYDECGPNAQCANGECIEGACVVPACNDGLQNGLETDVDCGGPECSSCDVGQGCAGSGDCGAAQYGSWGTCVFPSNVCARTGQQVRSVTSYTCANGTCQEVIGEEMRACERQTENLSCGDNTASAWSACEGFSGVCGQTGTRSRTLSTYRCSDGACRTSTSTESETCTRSTAGNTCQATSYGTYSACSYSSQCATTGTRSRSVTEYVCASGSCEAVISTETTSSGCARTTGGDSCGTTQTGPWSTCGGFSDTCDQTGTRSRSVTTYTCGSGTCGSSATTQTESCTRTTNGTSCGTASCGDWSFCQPEGDSTCGGQQTRECTTYACSSGTCQSSTGPQSRGCTSTHCVCNQQIGTCGPGGLCDCSGGCGNCGFNETCCFESGGSYCAQACF